MCGIAGILTSQNSVSTAILKQMTDAIAHRGPDGDGHWVSNSGNVGFGHRRLAIIDLTDAGKQPMSYANKRYTITFNGEIYNYLELRDRLIKRGHQFISTCDTEVLLALYDNQKEQCLHELDGMFAFAIWDEKEQKLFCARDRFGEKPFFYAIHNNAFYFASEMKALWAAGIPRTINNRMLFNYLSEGFVKNPQDTSETFFNLISSLKPAHYFFVSPSNVRPSQTRYWDIDYQNVNENIGEEAAAGRFRELFTQSVRRRLRSDVPLGSSLSGGLDSSLIVCLIDELDKDKKQPQFTFSARFKNFAKDEGKYMQMVIDKTNVKPNFVFPDEEGLSADFDKLFYHQEEPFGSASIYAQFCVMRLAKENQVTVLLDGQGADELLAGYNYYFTDYFRELKSKDVRLLKLEQRAYRQNRLDGFGPNLKAVSRNFLLNVMPEKSIAKARRLKQRWQDSQYIDRDFYHEHSKDSFSAIYEPSKTLHESLYKSVFDGALETLLRYADRDSMAHSREVRLPFLNHQLAEFIFSLPPDFKIRNGVTKSIMRVAFEDILPIEIVKRKDKIGFEPPQRDWLKSSRMRARSIEAKANLSKMKIFRFSSKDNQSSNGSKEDWQYLMLDCSFQ